jgi:sialate O-acetylesterase
MQGKAFAFVTSWRGFAAVLLCLLACQSATYGATAAAAIFGSNMVLQRGQPVPVFGTATPGTVVTVAFANQNVNATTDAARTWRVDLNSMTASTAPSSMTITSAGSPQITFTGVQVGEVWVVSGQSNMDMRLDEADESAPYIADAPNRNIRLFLMKAGNGPSTTTWQAASATTAAAFSAVGYWTGLELSKKLNVPIGLIQATHDGTNISEWQTTNGGTGADYLAMVKPVQPYAVKAIGWYQGESNGGDSAYETKLTAMISEWRTGWGQQTLPFGIVQLPAQKWTTSRLAQFKVSINVPQTFLVVTHDLPGSSQLHPTAKKQVGVRMGIGARAMVYGEAIVPGGPVRLGAPSSTVNGNKVTLKFANAGTTLKTTTGAAPTTFQLATASGRFSNATATIVAPDTIELTSSVAAPKRVQYGISAAGNLWNTVSIPIEGGAATVTQLPASLFDVTFP